MSAVSHAVVASRADVRARPVLALASGLLGVPGSTVAWDLPAGGFWIGMPLAAIAMVLGLLALTRSTGRRRGMAAAAVALGASEVLFVAGCVLFF